MLKGLNIYVHGDLNIGEYEPGNGNRYTAIATRWSAGLVMMGTLGLVDEGWLVVSGNTGKAALFQERGFLTDDYIQEKLGGWLDDYPYFGDLIRLLVMRPGPALPMSIPTEEDMPEDREAYYNERAEMMP